MRLFLFFSGLMFLIGCSGDNFNSMQRGDDSQQQFSEQGDFSPHSEEIRNLASETEIVKIGNKQHQSVNVGNTLGQNNLRVSQRKQGSTTRVVVSLNSENVITNLGSTAITGAGSSDEEGPELSILIYMQNRQNVCVQNLRKHHTAFLNGISDYDWRIAFAYQGDSFTDQKGRPLSSDTLLIPLQKHRHVQADGRWFKRQYRYVLAAGQGDIADLFKGTLTSFDATYRPSGDKGPAPVTRGDEIKSQDANPDKASSAFSAVNQILQTHFANSRRNVVLFYGDNIPYYTDQEWAQFYQNNPNLSLFFISTREASLYNVDRLLSSSNYDANFVPGCDVNIKRYPSKYGEHLESLLGQIASRL